MAYSIMLDAGHGGQDPGAVYKGRQEKDDNLKLALAVGKILENNGINVLYTRTTDVYQTPFEKAQLANQAKVDYFISFHRNSSSGEDKYTGVEVLVYDKSGIKYQMAENILGALGEIGFREIGVKERPGLVVLRKTRMPALLIETGFINSEKDNQLFDNKFDEIAQSIADASWGTFLTFLSYKAEMNDKQIVKIGRYYPSSKTCHHCGYVKEDLTLKDREWICPQCGELIDRDLNAAINILNEGLKNISAGTVDYTDGEGVRLVYKHSLMKSESHKSLACG